MRAGHRGALLILLLAGAACTTTTAVPAASAIATDGPAGAPDIVHQYPAQGCERLQARGLQATFVLYRPDGSRYAVCNAHRAAQRFLPASTFKIANALIGLETGAVRDEYQVTKWDGMARGVAVWNQDADLASGMRNSTVWFYQALARRIGAARMRDWVGRLGYGNTDIGADRAVGHFWLNGALRINAFEQIAFLDRLSRYRLPLSERSQAIVIRIIEWDRGAGWVLRGKTGAALPIDPITGALLPGERGAGNLQGAEPVGWFVGWVERAGQPPALFAFNLKLRGNADMPLREQLARELLVANGVLPAAGER